MLPKLKSMNFEIELIRPSLCRRKNQLNGWVLIVLPMNCGCTVAADKTSSKRRETKELIAELVKNNPDIKKNHSIYSEC